MANIRRTLVGDGASSCAAPNRAELMTGWGGSYDLKPELFFGSVVQLCCRFVIEKRGILNFVHYSWKLPKMLVISSKIVHARYHCMLPLHDNIA